MVVVTNTAMTDDRHSQSEAEMGEREGKGDGDRTA